MICQTAVSKHASNCWDSCHSRDRLRIYELHMSRYITISAIQTLDVLIDVVKVAVSLPPSPILDCPEVFCQTKAYHKLLFYKRHVRNLQSKHYNCPSPGLSVQLMPHLCSFWGGLSWHYAKGPLRLHRSHEQQHKRLVCKLKQINSRPGMVVHCTHVMMPFAAITVSMLKQRCLVSS
jgi:hypothetical protein